MGLLSLSNFFLNFKYFRVQLFSQFSVFFPQIVNFSLELDLQLSHLAPDLFVLGGQKLIFFISFLIFITVSTWCYLFKLFDWLPMSHSRFPQSFLPLFLLLSLISITFNRPSSVLHKFINFFNCFVCSIFFGFLQQNLLLLLLEHVIGGFVDEPIHLGFDIAQLFLQS